MEEKKTRVFEFSDGRKLEVDIEDLNYIFGGHRPRLMSIEDFKIISKVLQKENKQYLKGRLFHVSKVTDALFQEYVKDIKDIKYKPIQKGKTYIKLKDDGKRK